MNLRTIGCNVDSATVEIREKLAFDQEKLARALSELPRTDRAAPYAS